MDISYVLTIIFMILILIWGIIGLCSPNRIIEYYLKYTKHHSGVVRTINKSWFYPSFKISSFLLILYSIAIIILIMRKTVL